MTEVHNTKTFCLQQTDIADRSQESSKYGVKIYPFWGRGGVKKFQILRNLLKYPYFGEIWNTH